MDRNLNVLFIANGIGFLGNLPGISGGDIRWLEISKRWQKKGYVINVFTCEAGKNLCEKMGLHATFHISNVPNEYSLKTYLQRFAKSGIIPETLKNYEGTIYSTTEHFYDTFPAMKIRKKNKNNIWAAVVHWVAPLKRKGTSKLNGALFFFNQRMGFKCIEKDADIVLAISDNTAEQMKKMGFSPRIVFSVEAGVDYSAIGEIANKVHTKKYDAFFMKRFSGTKGVFDIIEIWREVARKKEDAKLGLAGLGTEGTMTKLKRMVKAYGIKDNVDFLGPIYDFNSKISVLASAKLFVLPSYEENWAIVIGEAMAAGVPVLCYDLPAIKSIWNDKVVWIPKGDKLAFAAKVIELLGDKEPRNALSQMGTLFMKRFDWDEIAEKEMRMITNWAEGAVL
jgi:glycosyltransferase involved in cell wall biosynthesis